MRTMCKEITFRLDAFLLILTTGLLTPGMMRSAIAQVTSDGTTNTIVNPSGNNFTILNGINKGNNLFHSFSNFSVPTGGSATFDLTKTPNITTIFSRVTGGNVSNIDGLIQTLHGNNPVSLFLMNPAGIVFGQNASLNIGGSFVGTTANSIKFADGTEFSAVNPTAPLLTMSVPIGLQMGQNSRDITVQGSGHNVSLVGLSLLQRGVDNNGLQVKPSNNITLVGGNINLDGGLLIADSGNIEIAALHDGEWKIQQNNSALMSVTPSSTNFGNIQLRSSALIDVSGIAAGSVDLVGKQIELQGGSAVISQNLGGQSGGSINIKASELFTVIGSTTNLPSFLNTQTLGTGAAGDININSPNVLLDAGGAIQTQTFSSAQSGNINLQAPELLQIAGVNTLIPSNRTGIANATFSSGNTGDIHISTGRLIVRDGSTAASTVTLGTGNTGEVVVNASESINLSGSSPVSVSDISAVSFGKGNGGNIVVNTPRLTISNAAGVLSTTYASGNAGSVTINASDVIELIGLGDENAPVLSVNNPIASAAVSTKGSFLQALLGLPDEATGDGGNVSINTSRLNIKNQARISVGSDSTGKAGTISLNVNALSLDNGAGIVASTASGNGGNIDLNLREILLMRHDSLINSEAKGIGNGGNISINSPIIVGLENSDIIASAVNGRGGNIEISTQGIIGLEFRNTLTPRTDLTNDITASSQFNVNGTVQINHIGVDPNSGLIELPANVTDSSQQIASGCSANTDSSFVATGRGGIPQNPNQQLTSLRPWSDIRNLTAYRHTGAVTTQIPQSPEVLVQATGWRRNAQGKIEIFADKSPTQQQPALTCAAVPKS